MHGQRARHSSDRARGGDRLRAQPVDGHPERPRGGLALACGGERQPERRTRQCGEAEGGEAGERKRKLVVLVRRRPVRRDHEPLRPADQPRQRLQRECERPGDDPGRRGEGGAGQTREADADHSARHGTRDAAADRRQGQRHAVREKSGGHNGAGRDQAALGEQR